MQVPSSHTSVVVTPGRRPASAPVVAWDVETCPQPAEALGERGRRRLEMEAARLADREGLPVEAARRKAASLHPMLGWICCISACRLYPAGMPGQPKTYSAAAPAGERDLLVAFWNDVARLPGTVHWVTFNGKRFDCDWLRVRSAAHGLTPTRRDLLDTYPFKQRPHCDLSRSFDCTGGLADLCELLGIESPKQGLDGSGIAAAVEEGRIDEVARYCEADVVATLRAFVRLGDLV